jgi:hypothetical protein
MCVQAENLLSSHETIAPADYPVVYAQEREARRHAHGDRSIPGRGRLSLTNPCLREIASNLLDSNIAGHEGGGDVLVCLHRELADNPGLQVQLHRELMTLNPPMLYPVDEGAEFKMSTPQDVDKLPLLDAILMETFRLCVQRVGQQARVPGPSKCLIADFDIPGDVQIQCYPYIFHRNPDVFLEPEFWNPYRWIEADSTRLGRMKRAFWPFGRGPRTCIGQHISIHCKPFPENKMTEVLIGGVAMKFHIAAVCTNYRTISRYGNSKREEYLAAQKGQLRLMLRRWDRLESPK